MLGAAAAAPPAAPTPASTPLRIVGSLASLHPYRQHEEPFWGQELPRLTGGRFRAEIVPFDRAGLRGPEMLQLVKLGAVPFGTVPLSLSAALHPDLGGADLAGLNANLPSLERSVAAFRPYLQSTLRERFDAELLALYVYPAQVTFCRQPLTGLDDLRGRRVRVSSPSQTDFVLGLGAAPVQMAFADIADNLRRGSIDCAITGTMSGHIVGLHELTSHVHTMPINWGLAAFVAHRGTWNALPADLRALLGRELPKLEARVWESAARETDDGTACNTGVADCGKRRGRMTAVPVSAADAQRRSELLQSTVLPRWLDRCGAPCVELWQRVLGPATGIALP